MITNELMLLIAVTFIALSILYYEKEKDYQKALEKMRFYKNKLEEMEK